MGVESHLLLRFYSQTRLQPSTGPVSRARFPRRSPATALCGGGLPKVMRMAVKCRSKWRTRKGQQAPNPATGGLMSRAAARSESIARFTPEAFILRVKALGAVVTFRLPTGGRMTRRTKRKLHTILADEHIPETVINNVEESGWFNVIRAARDSRFRGREELDYINELRARNIVFLTQDGGFVKRIASDRVHHAGIILLPPGREAEELGAEIIVVCGRVQRYLDDQRSRGAHGVVFQVDESGIYTIVGGKKRLEMSIQQIMHEIEEDLREPGLFDDVYNELGR